ncbi:HAD family hydrolase [Balneola vulgaris]|uniref:HAD family hydrolase n=1 Tax=Balneola vulgaris TaxID=287535 RepID=UPI00036C9BB5|nr:HAD hydrolase-like protein [Balneola vulgaris]
MPHPWIALFDIDGTLLRVQHSFVRPMLRAILQEFEIDYPNMEKDAFSGRTDHDILNSFLVNHGYSNSLYSQIKERYIQQTDTLLAPEHVEPLPYIHQAIDFFDAMNAEVGLLTGNYPRSAQAKLRAAQIEYPFSFGIFGEFHKNRNDLPLLALDEVKDRLGVQPDPSKFLIIGDTPKDVECAKFAGMKSVAIATGNYSYEELMETDADIVLHNLSEPEVWFNQLINNASL